MRNKLWLSLVLVGLTACTAPGSKLPEKATGPLGLLKVTISGIGEGVTPDAKAEWVNAGVNGQAVTVVPVAGLNNPGDIYFSRRWVSFFDDDSNTVRYVTASFDIYNHTDINFDNLVLYAVNVPGVSVGGTGIISMNDGTGAAITNEAKFRAFEPDHGVRANRTAVVVNSDIANLHLVGPNEAENVQTLGLSTPDPFNPGNNVLPAGSKVLGYGFVANNYLPGLGVLLSRGISGRNSATLCTNANNNCRGLVTFSYSFPKVSPRNLNPFTFSLYFVVANQTLDDLSQSYYESASNTVAGMSQTSPDVAAFDRVKTLLGSSYTGANELDLCTVPIAVPTVLSPGYKHLPDVSTPGGPDVCFDVDGKVTTAIGTALDQAQSVALQSDSKIVVAGFSFNGSNRDFALARYNAGGSLDTTFDSDGKVTTAIGTGLDEAHSIAIQSDGKIVVAGYSDNGSNRDFALARYNTNGSLDTSFDGDATMPGFPGNGKVTTTIGSDTDEAQSIVLQSDGKIVVAGYFDTDPTAGINNDFALARYNPDGTLDTTFDGDGKVTTAIGSNMDQAYALAIQSDGKIVVTGRSDTDPTASISDDFALARYNTDGTLDTGFDGDGKVTTAVSLSFDHAYALAIQSDGKIVVGGAGNNTDFALVRYNTNGSLDTSFDTDGKAITAIGQNADVVRSLAIQSDGKIVAAGYYDADPTAGVNWDFAMARYTTGGSLDTGFDGDGKVTTAIGSGDDIGYSLAIQSDGKIVVAGYSDNGSNDDFAVVRYHP